MDTNSSDFPIRTLFVNESVFHPYAKLDNDKFPWEDIDYTANRIWDLLRQNWTIYSVHELIRVRFSRAAANLIGWKKPAKVFLKKVFRQVKDANKNWPNFMEIELHAPQK